jgi:hypothetical protein
MDAARDAGTLLQRLCRSHPGTDCWGVLESAGQLLPWRNAAEMPAWKVPAATKRRHLS